MVPLKINCHIWTHHTQIPISFHFLKKILTLENHGTHIVSVMRPGSFDLVFLGSLFHWSISGRAKASNTNQPTSDGDESTSWKQSYTRQGLPVAKMWGLWRKIQRYIKTIWICKKNMPSPNNLTLHYCVKGASYACWEDCLKNYRKRKLLKSHIRDMHTYLSFKKIPQVLSYYIATPYQLSNAMLQLLHSMLK